MCRCSSLDYALRQAIAQHDHRHRAVGAAQSRPPRRRDAHDAGRPRRHDLRRHRRLRRHRTRLCLFRSSRRRRGERRAHRARDAGREDLLDRGRAGARARAHRLHRRLRADRRCAAREAEHAVGDAALASRSRPRVRTAAWSGRGAHAGRSTAAAKRNSAAATSARRRRGIPYRHDRAQDRVAQRAGDRGALLSHGGSVRGLSRRGAAGASGARGRAAACGLRRDADRAPQRASARDARRHRAAHRGRRLHTAGADGRAATRSASSTAPSST